MNNAYKKEEMKLVAFKIYLLNDAKLADSTASDYVKRIISTCKEEGFDYDYLIEHIDKVTYDYIEGEKQELGKRSHNSYRSALLQFQKFVNQGGTIKPNNNKPNYHFEIDQVKGERFGTIKLYDKDGNLIDTQTTLDLHHHTSREATKDLTAKCIAMMFNNVYNKDSIKFYEVLKLLDCSLTMSGKDLV